MQYSSMVRLRISLLNSNREKLRIVILLWTKCMVCLFSCPFPVSVIMHVMTLQHCSGLFPIPSLVFLDCHVTIRLDKIIDISLYGASHMCTSATLVCTCISHFQLQCCCKLRKHSCAFFQHCLYSATHIHSNDSDFVNHRQRYPKPIRL